MLSQEDRVDTIDGVPILDAVVVLLMLTLLLLVATPLRVTLLSVIEAAPRRVAPLSPDLGAGMVP